MSKWIKIPVWFVLSVLVLSTGIRFALKSDIVLQKVLDIGLAQVPKYLNAELSISSLNGDLLSEFSMTDILLSAEGDTVAALDELYVSYNFWELLNKTLEIDSLSVQNPTIRIIENPDSSLNVATLIRESGETAPDDSTSSEFGFILHQLVLTDGNARYTSYFSPENLNTTISNLNLGIAAEYSTEKMALSLNKLGFQIQNPLLPSPISLKGSGETDGKKFTLDSLSISDGISLFNLAADYGIADTSLRTQLTSTNFGMQSLPDSLVSIDQNQRFSLQVNLGLEGANIVAGIVISTEFLDEFSLAVTANLENSRVQSVSLEGKNWQLDKLLNNPELPSFSSLKYSGEGNIYLEDVQKSTWENKLQVSEIRHAELKNALTEAIISASFVKGKVESDFRLKTSKGKVWTQIKSDNVFAHSDSINWGGEITIDSLFPAQFRSEFVNTDVLNTTIVASGVGINPDRLSANVTILAEGINFSNQEMGNVDANLDYKNKRIDYEIGIRLQQSELFSDGYIVLNELEEYAFIFQTEKFNLAEIQGLETFPTQLNGSGQIIGSGFTLEQLSASARVNLTKSLINGELIDDFSGNVLLEEHILTIHDGNLVSTLAQAKFEARRNLKDKLDSDNYLSLDAEINDLRSLAPLLGVDRFQVKGNIKGTVSEEEDGLVAQFETNLNSIVFDDLRIAEIKGTVSGKANPTPNLEASLKVSDIVQGNYAIQSVELSLGGVKPDSLFSGNFLAQILARNDTKIRLEGTVDQNNEGKEIQLRTASFTGVKRNMHLQNPVFIVATHSGTISMSTLDLRHDKSVFIHIDTVYYSPEETIISLQAKQLSLQIIQTLFASDYSIEGWLDVDISAHLNQEKEIIESQFDIYDLVYDRLKVDSMKVSANLADELLTANYGVITNGRKISSGYLRLPYSKFNVPKNAKEEGYISIDLPNFDLIRPFLDDLAIEDINGAFRSEVLIAGSLDKPEIVGFAKLETPTFAGISLDSLRMDFSYDHTQQRANVVGTADLARVRLAEINGYFPFHYQPNTLTVDLPSPTDSVGLRVNSNDFNLGFFQPFLMALGVTKLGGKFYADIDLSGTLENLKADGVAKVQKLEADYLPYKLKFRDGDIDVSLSKDRISITKASIESGRGKLQSSGYIDIENLQPKAYQIAIKGNQFAVSQNKDLSVWLGTDLSLTGTAKSPQLKGSITLNDAEIWLPDFGIKTVESVTLEEKESANDFLYDSLSINIALIIPETLAGSAQKVRVRKKSTPEIDLIMEGNIRVEKKRGGELQLFGPIGASSGYVRELGKKFDLLKGEVAFTGPPEDPLLSFETLYEIPRDDIKIYFRISGSLENPEFTYESEPPMETQDIVSYVLFGRPFAALAGWQSTVASANSGDSNELKDKATELLLNKASEVAADMLGLDVVEIDDSNQTTGAGMTIKAGKYLNERILVAVIQQMGTNSTTQFTLEYQLRKNLQFIFTQSEDNRTGVDILWRYEY